MNGYFTVEATMLFPVVFFVYAFIFYIGFYQYDRCLVEQDGMLAALRGEEAAAGGAGLALERMASAVGAEARKKYIALQTEAPKLRAGRGKVRVTLGGRITFPFAHMLPFLDGNWEISESTALVAQNPVAFIRLLMRLKGDEENVENTERGDFGQNLPES